MIFLGLFCVGALNRLWLVMLSGIMCGQKAQND